MFHRLFRLLVPGKVVTFTMAGRRSSMRVRRLLVKLSCSLMRIVCHFYSPRVASPTLSCPTCDVYQHMCADQKGYSADDPSDSAQGKRWKQRLYSNLFFRSYIQPQHTEPSRHD